MASNLAANQHKLGEHLYFFDCGAVTNEILVVGHGGFERHTGTFTVPANFNLYFLSAHNQALFSSVSEVIEYVPGSTMDIYLVPSGNVCWNYGLEKAVGKHDPTKYPVDYKDIANVQSLALDGMTNHPHRAYGHGGGGRRHNTHVVSIRNHKGLYAREIDLEFVMNKLSQNANTLPNMGTGPYVVYVNACRDFVGKGIPPVHANVDDGTLMHF